jgi:CheY-like chemotaxis protein
MKNVLLVDDDSVFNFLNTKMLHRIGVTSDIDVALNGEQAIKLFNGYFGGSKPLPDIILLDLNMPIMDGFSFLQAFRGLNLTNKDHVKIIVVSSSDNPSDIRRAKELGACEHLTKPLDEQSLTRALDFREEVFVSVPNNN